MVVGEVVVVAVLIVVVVVVAAVAGATAAAAAHAAAAVTLVCSSSSAEHARCSSAKQTEPPQHRHKPENSRDSWSGFGVLARESQVQASGAAVGASSVAASSSPAASSRLLHFLLLDHLGALMGTVKTSDVGYAGYV